MPATIRWRVSVPPSTPLPVPGIGRARWGGELIRCRRGDSATFALQARDAKDRLALDSTPAYRPTQAALARM
jgi:protein ImuA